MMNCRTSVYTLLLLCVLSITPFNTVLAAQESADDRAIPLVLSRLSGPITLDGYSDEPAWQALEPLPLTMMLPIFEGTMTERTEIRVAYDDDYLYVAGRMYDSDPAGIRAVDIVRDRANWQNDWLGIVLDSFNDNENALTFWANPAGLRTDIAVSNDAGAMNVSWSTFWDAAAVRNEEGWFVELRIPFSSLRFQDEDGEVIMGLIAARFIARKSELHVFPAIPPDWGMYSFWKPSQAQKVRFAGVYSRNPLYITPYALGGLNQVPVLIFTESEDAYKQDNTLTSDIGLDLKYGLTSNLTLDLTFNPDFAQAEADDQRINLTRFSLFFPEKRLFFQERASTFEFGLGGNNRLFHSRRIGIQGGQQVPIYGGARLVGRVGSWDLGIINMQTAPLEDDDGQITQSSENMGVARLRRQVLNPYSYAGGMVTSRISSEGDYNYAYGLDGIFRLFGQDYLEASWAQTLDSGWEEKPNPLDAGQIRFFWERRGTTGVLYDAHFYRRGASFQPGLGFVNRTDVTYFRGRLGFGWLATESSPLQRQLLRLIWNEHRSISTGEVESALTRLSWYLLTKRQASVQFYLDYNTENLSRTFNLASDASVYPGDYNFLDAYLQYNMPTGTLLRVNSWVRVGQYYDGRRLTARVAPTWRIPSQYFTAGGSIRYDYITFPERDQEYVNWLYVLNLQASFNVTTSVAGLIQYNKAIDAVIVNLRLRYNPREGTDLYLVYNDNLNTDRQREDPELPLSGTRAVLLKYSVTFLPSLR